MIARPISWALALALIAVVGAIAAPARIRNKMADFEVYRTASSRAAAAEPLYRASDEHYRFKYLPAFAIAIRPVAALPESLSKRIWFGLSLAMLVALVVLSLHLLPGPAEGTCGKRQTRTRFPQGSAGHDEGQPLSLPRWAIVGGTIVTLAKFYGHELVLGQTNLLLGATIAVALTGLKYRHEAAAGAAFGAAVVIKPYAVVFLPYLIARRRDLAALTGAVVILLALAAPSITYGIQGNVDLLRAWWQTVTTSTAPNLTNQDNVSVAAMYAKWLGVGPNASRLATATNIVLVLVIGTVVVVRSRSRFREYLDVALLSTAIPLLSPQGWDYVLLLSTPAIMLVLKCLPQLPRGIRVVTVASLAAVGLSLYDVMGREAYAEFMALSGITVCYAILIAVIVSLRARQIA